MFSADESVLTDQFIGLAATVSLPETKVEVRRSHIVGVGRDVVIQEPQRFSNDGGSIETMMNSARWLYYALGREVIDVPSTSDRPKDTVNWTSRQVILTLDTQAHLQISRQVTTSLFDSEAVAFRDTPAAASKEWGADGTGIDMENKRNEIRQVLYIDTTTRRIHVEEPFYFNHEVADYTLKALKYDAGSSNGSPHLILPPLHMVLSPTVSRDFSFLAQHFLHSVLSQASEPTTQVHSMRATKG